MLAGLRFHVDADREAVKRFAANRRRPQLLTDAAISVSA